MSIYQGHPNPIKYILAYLVFVIITVIGLSIIYTPKNNEDINSNNSSNIEFLKELKNCHEELQKINRKIDRF